MMIYLQLMSWQLASNGMSMESWNRIWDIRGKVWENAMDQHPTAAERIDNAIEL